MVGGANGLQITRFAHARTRARVSPSSLPQAVLSRRGNAVILAHYHRVYGSGADVSAEIERVKVSGGVRVRGCGGAVGGTWRVCTCYCVP